ncbi:hypothetical protein [Acidiferrobacter sp.]|uniref:hypothetical protein n=1 Tax=Acidiferrobacter sp. TaxID=1872107 RepID=UPI00260CA072|nr:hypothetical protein [Acidiferrobacter sp.]
MSVKTQIAAIQERIDALTLRERILLFAAIVTVTYGFIIVAAIHPLENRARTATADLASLHAKTRQIDTRLDAILAPGARAREAAELRALARKVHVLKARLARLTAGLVPARDMPALLRQVLARSPGVTVVSLVDRRVIAVRRSPKDKPFLYRHEMTLVVRGAYAALLRYLTVLAHTKRHVLWGRVTLTADRYPFSTVRLRVYTLSTHEALLQ